MEKQCQKKIKEKGPKAKTHSSPAGGYAAETGVFCFNFDNKVGISYTLAKSFLYT